MSVESSIGGVATQVGVRRLTWVALLIGGGVIWMIAAAVTAATHDDILLPTLILGRSFLVPVTIVTFALTRQGEDQLPADWLVLSFVLGGSVGVVVSALLESYLTPAFTGTFIGVGFIEELTALILLAVASRLPRIRARDGMVFGATVGAGFAAFESAGYALNTLLQNEQHRPVLNILQTELTRAVSVPFAHIAWTALFGGALLAARRSDGKLRLTWPLTGTLLGVVALHALWDQSSGWAIFITKGLNGDGWTLAWPDTEDWTGLAPTHTELLTNQWVYNGLLLLLSLVGTLWVVHNWRRYCAPDREPSRAAAPPWPAPSLDIGYSSFRSPTDAGSASRGRNSY